MQIKATVVQKETIAPAWWRLLLHAPDLAGAPRPGQFVLVDCGDACYLRRPIFPQFLDDQHLDFLLQPSPDPGFAWLLTRTTGDVLDLLGPFGRGFPQPHVPSNLLLVSDSSLLSPLLDQMLRALAINVSVTLALESRRSAKLYPISQLPPAVEVQLATHDGATGHHGPIKDLLPDLIRWADRAYAVGSGKLYQTLLAITKEVRFGLQPEFLYGLLTSVSMPCGVGACFGCAVSIDGELQLTCIDGPVFDLSKFVI
jgi:dihydroorotate dehydrogenase electron transfer subunit